MSTRMPFGLLLCMAMACGSPSTKDGDTDTDTETDSPTDAETDTETDTTDTETDDSDTDDTDVYIPPDPAKVELGGACPLADRRGGILVTMAEFYSAVSGQVRDGVNPIEVLTDVGGNTECRLLKRELFFCDPLCTGGDTCNADGECIPFPSTIDLGHLTVDGLVEQVELDPLTPGYQYSNTGVPHPLVVTDQLVTLHTSGGANAPATTLHGVGFEPIGLVNDDIWLLEAGQPLTMTWTPPVKATLDRAEVQIIVDIDQHGASPVKAYCTFEDDGEAQLPSEIVDELIAFGVSGYPNASVRRRTVDQVLLPDDGCMEFEIRSGVAPTVRVDGYIPCSSSFDCPGDQECNLAIQLCEDP